MIKVIEVKRNLTDLSLVGEDELDILLESQDIAPETRYSYHALAKILQSSVSTLNPVAEASKSILCRGLLTNSAAIPVILARGQKAASEDVNNLYVRPSTRIKAIHSGKVVNISAEEPIVVKEVLIDSKYSGDVILQLFNAHLGLDTYVESGLQTVPVYSVLATKIKTNPVSFGLNISAALDQIRSDIDYHFSGVKLTMDLLNKARKSDKAQVALLDFVRQTTPAKLNTWRKKNAEIIIDYILDQIHAKSSDIYDLNGLNELYQYEAFDAYKFAIVEGRESDNVKQIIDNIHAKKFKNLQMDKLQNDALQAISKARHLMLIVEEKFGSNRYEEIINKLRITNGVKSRLGPGGAMSNFRGNVQVDNPHIVLSILTKREREITMIEYDNKVKSWAASAKNKCAHLPISFKLRHAPTKIATTEAFQQLETFFEKVTDHSWIMCNVCNFRIMCPHFHDFMKIKDAPYDHICKKLFKYALKSDTTEDASVYCKICGEKIYEINDDLPNSIYGSFDSGLKNKIWSLAMNILLSVQFSNPLDYRKLSNEIAESILPYVISAESTHAKRKKRITREDSLDETHVDPITHLLMVIYIHAFILDMIASSSNDISFNGAKRGSKISVFAEVMFKNIITTNKNIIDQIDNITIEYIKTHFSNAYKLLHQNGDLSYTVPNPEEELAINTTTIDPTYRYMVQVAKQMGDLPNRMAKTPNECKKEFELVMGNSLPNIIASTKAAMKDPILASIFLRKANMEIPIGTTWAFLLKDPRLNLYSHMYTRSGKKGGNDIVADGGYITADGGKQRPHGHSRHAHSHSKPAHHAHSHSQPAHSHPKPARRSPQAPNDPMAEAIFNESYDLFVDYTKNIVNQTLLDEYNEKIKSFKAREKEWLSGRFVTYLKSFYDFKFKLGGQFSIQDIPITMLYDENGHKHKWGIFVYAADGAAADDVSSADAAAPLVEITNPFKARSDGEIGPHHVLVDKKCTVCGVLRSQISTLSVEKTIVELKNNREKSAFFLFYKSRCPIGGVHEYAQKTNACIKCGLNDAKTNEYYKKYHDRFNEQKIEIKNNQNVFNVDTAAAAAAATAGATRFSKWEPNYTPIVELAAFANTSTVVIEAIGNMDGRPYADIIKGVDIPAEPKNSLDPRIYATDSEVRLILTNYNMLRNAPKITNLKPHIADFLESIPASDWGQLATLPDIKGDYYERLAHILKTDTASNAYKFIVQSLCEMILKISQPIGVEWMDKLKMDYAKKEISVILHSQKMFSKHGNFNWSIFDVGDDDVVDVGDEAASEADTEKDFYSGDIDYDVSEANPNNDPE